MEKEAREGEQDGGEGCEAQGKSQEEVALVSAQATDA